MPAEAVLATLDRVWRTLEPTPMALMGGVALSVWGHLRATYDADLLVGAGTAEAGKLLDRLRPLGARPRRTPPVVHLDGVDMLQLSIPAPERDLEIQVDVALECTDFLSEVIARRVPAQLPGWDTAYAVVTCEDLILLKLLAGRMIDRADVAALLRTNRNDLDLRYMQKWLTTWDLSAQFEDVWNETFADEAR